MIRCWPSVAKLYEPHEICENRVTFVNVKSKYCIDEDLTLNYNLQEEFKSSTRDWIGIFPRNWLNLQQYLTFEYTLPSPPYAENSLNRTITFPRIFHREASQILDYQFLYVSREIQIMAISSFFRFTSLPTNNGIQRSKFINSCQSVDMIPNGTLENINPAKGLRQTCRWCHRQICGLKIDALRGNFLASFSDSLLDRVRRLERDLSLAETNLKNVRNSRENTTKRLRAYEAFVAEMLSSVGAHGIVELTDENGIKIVLQRVKKKDSLIFENTKKADPLENVIADLKNIVTRQQKTIEDLMEQRNMSISRREPIKFIDREVQTNSPQKSIVSSENHTRAEENLNGEKICSDIENSKINENPSIVPKVLIDESDTLKRFSEGRIVCPKCSSSQNLLKTGNPSGILIQGKNVKFAIVRYYT